MYLRNILILAAALVLGMPLAAALADYVYTDTNGNHTVFSFVCQTTKLCTGFVIMDSTGTEKATSANPVIVGGAGQQAPGASMSTVQAQDTRPSAGSITVVDSGSSSTTGQNGAPIITGTPTSGSAVPQTVNGLAVARFQLSGTWTGTIEFEQSIDGGTTWGLLGCHVNGSSGGQTGSSFTANGIFDCEAAGATNVRARATAAITGTATVTVVMTVNAGVGKVSNPIAIKDNASGNQATIKSASTAAVASDPSVVVQTSPNDANIGAPGATACASDTGSCSLNALLQRIAQRLTTMITGPLQSVNQPSSSSANGLSPTSTSALATSQVIKGSAGNLYSFEVSADSTLSASAWWIMIFNATSAPADGSVTPAKCYAVPTGTTSYASAWLVPINFPSGIVIAVSTTGCYTKTSSTHAFISGDAQ